MDVGLFTQYVVIALAVLLSAGVVAQKQFPAGVRRMRIACAVPLVREGRAPWLRRIGRWLAPKPHEADSGCGSCDRCGSGH